MAASACSGSAFAAETGPLQPTVQTATHLLIWLCQLLIIGLTPISWGHLREAEDRATRLWFAGLCVITFSSLVLGFVQRANGITGSTMVAGTWLFVEAMRREAGRPPARWRWVAPPLAALLLAYAAIEWRGLYGSAGVILTSVALVVLETALVYQIYTVGRPLRSRGLVMVGAGILPVAFVNLARLVSVLAEGQSQPMFAPNPFSTSIVLAYTIFSILTTVGFLAYRLEKAHHRSMIELEEATRRQLAEQKQHEEELRRAKETAESLNRTLEAANQRLAQVAIVDNLTGLWNRRHFDDVVVAEMAKADRHELPLSLVLLDVDHFKQINDTHGHMAGDRVLVELSMVAQHVIRKSDLLFRWGGEEFLLLLPNTGLAGAYAVAEKLRASFAEHAIPGVGVVTASFGVVAHEPRQSLDALMRRADRAMYEAKGGGRNVVKAAA
ncbi:GGDEF domain-containing protein [Ramlibacter sp. MAHUQ-53]|uniref:GGDEF domain-containing protein n=1 Tax=unclassified Ramlibacter TaxID=2617605 RepID=UPI003642863E